MSRIMIGTPCGGGMVTQTYMTSLLGQALLNPDRLHPSQQKKYGLGIYTIAGESLISRGRNHIATTALNQGWDKLFFIDADVSWNWKQMKSVIDKCGVEKNAGIVAGACPLKTPQLPLNFMPFPEDEKYFQEKDGSPSVKTCGRTIHMAMEKKQTAIPVPYIGTAFMCIDIQVLKDLQAVAPVYKYPDPISGESIDHWDFFPCGPVKNQFMSEDWGFCHIAREAGHTVILDADVFVNHTGPFTFSCDVEAELKKRSEEMLDTGVADAKGEE